MTALATMTNNICQHPSAMPGATALEVRAPSGNPTAGLIRRLAERIGPFKYDMWFGRARLQAKGERVDPYNQVASDQPFPAGNVVPTHMGQSQFFVMYSERISSTSYAAYRQAFSEWLVAYPQRTRRPEDCLLSYDVYLVTDQSPVWGATSKPKPLERQRFMTYSAPYDSPCRALHNRSLTGTATSRL